MSDSPHLRTPFRRFLLQTVSVTERDIEKNVPPTQFVDTLRRLADAIEAGEAFRIQVQNRRFSVPADAAIVIEHEIEDGREELALELQWASNSN